MILSAPRKVLSEKMKDDKDLLKKWGDNARRLSVDVYDKDILTAKVADVIENARLKAVIQ